MAKKAAFYCALSGAVVPDVIAGILRTPGQTVPCSCCGWPVKLRSAPAQGAVMFPRHRPSFDPTDECNRAAAWYAKR